jgi:hypothetical protein
VFKKAAHDADDLYRKFSRGLYNILHEFSLSPSGSSRRSAVVECPQGG